MRRLTARIRARTAALAAGAMLLAVAPALAHYAGFTGDVYQDNYVPSGQQRCIVGSSGCSAHSWSFISASDIGGANYMCSRAFAAGNHDYYDQHCGVDFVRHCTPGQNHSLNQLDCHDQDHNGRIHVGAYNGGPGTTIRMHGGY
jgi:hypothetical protein